MPDKSIIENSKTKVSKEEIDNFIFRSMKEKPNEQINISFWGGEPMMNMKLCMDIMTEHKDNKLVTFFFYTNGLYIKTFRESLKNINSLLGKTSNGEPRLVIQISYDGGKINDIERVTKNNKSSSVAVKEGFAILGEIGIERAIKSTITPRTFKYIYDAFLDIINIPGNDNYFPTPDSFSDYGIGEEKYFEQMADLQKGLQQIARYIYKNDLNPEIFGWFRRSRALCQAGINYYAVNLNGDMSPCHSTMYDNNGVHVIGNINDEDIFENLENSSNKYNDTLSFMNDDCADCDALFCMKCPAGSFELESTNKTANFKLADFVNNKNGLDNYTMKWTTKNINMCTVFKVNKEVYKALLSALNKKGK
jgi:radical SAM protein with 4Fe4S-binding SPASM domain